MLYILSTRIALATIALVLAMHAIPFNLISNADNRFTVLNLSAAAHASESPAAAEEILKVAKFSQGDVSGWEERSFKGSTVYKLKEDPEQGAVLQAVSNATASVFGKRVQIDLTKTPYINWQWKIDNRLEGLDETTKSGDDFAARIYLVKTAGLFGRKSKAVNYVWSSNKQQGSQWNNAFKPKNSRTIAVRGIEQPTGQWVMEKRNVAADFMQLYGAKIDQVDAVVIMSDTDNSGLSASASYGDIFFSSQ
jgi:hypothetical protein